MQQDRAARDRADRAAIEATLGGDHEAFGGLIAAYQRMVAGVAWRYGIPRDDVDDLVSEVFFKVFDNLHRYRPEHAFSTWLYRLAANHVLDHVRKHKRERLRDEMPLQLADDAAGPAERQASGERTELVRAGLEEVSPTYREAMFLVYIEGLRVDEASRALGVPSGTIKSRLLRGRAQLKEALERRHPGLFDDGVLS